MLLAAFMLATIGGRYAWPALPGLIAAAALFLVSGARVGADAATRSIDFTVIASLDFRGGQLAPLPPAVVHAFPPGTPSLQDAYALEPLGTWRRLSIHPAATRAGLVLALAAALVFWAAREAFSRGGSRAAARLLAWIGCACALVSLAQRATAPRTVLWAWTVPDPRAVPFGPFVDRNQLATWLVLAISLVAGYLAMHVRAHMTDRLRQGSRAGLVALSDGGSIGTLGCLAAMLVTLAAPLSRSGFVALVAAGGGGPSPARRRAIADASPRTKARIDSCASAPARGSSRSPCRASGKRASALPPPSCWPPSSRRSPSSIAANPRRRSLLHEHPCRIRRRRRRRELQQGVPADGGAGRRPGRRPRPVGPGVPRARRRRDEARLGSHRPDRAVVAAAGAVRGGRDRAAVQDVARAEVGGLLHDHAPLERGRDHAVPDAVVAGEPRLPAAVGADGPRVSRRRRQRVEARHRGRRPAHQLRRHHRRVALEGGAAAAQGRSDRARPGDGARHRRGRHARGGH